MTYSVKSEFPGQGPEQLLADTHHACDKPASYFYVLSVIQSQDALDGTHTVAVPGCADLIPRLWRKNSSWCVCMCVYMCSHVHIVCILCVHTGVYVCACVRVCCSHVCVVCTCVRVLCVNIMCVRVLTRTLCVHTCVTCVRAYVMCACVVCCVCVYTCMCTCVCLHTAAWRIGACS